MRAPRRVLAASTLCLESLVVLFASLVAKDLSGLGAPVSLGAGAALALVCLVVAGLLRTRAGYPLGWALQAAVIATGIWVPAMLFLGGVFALLWFVSLRTGARIERERADWASRQPG